uniref:NADH-ubiquinone oxidoreductase chain 6 n=2 Tax=Phraortes TaxID=590989 RepID=E2RUR5_PHRIL|nr:NADH dehydrogenase subunit 6 [Phraortes illepidus]YP_010601348.1 NADH dehydrogenase subunit 6 [Phraortes lii]WAL35427.1 NADH dehydrogenase subunit 6 [Phraortes lii]BAJ24449.1 NADH dehydrogenase subunit 6 [Phraortes illepidus]
MMMINMMMNMTFLMMKHPLSMGITIIIQTTIISMSTGMLYKSFWYSYILFLMYIGGMMVLFIYMTSLVPNKMFVMSMKKMLMTLMMMMITITIIKEMKLMTNFDMDMLEIKSNMLTKMYSNPSNMLTMMISMYLFFTMITAFKITEMNKGPLQMMN